ncbi:MBL fold metallo-hydrolase [Conexibacter woesei]|uniref:Metallo-beta-lactamase domain-containing protein n=1 Tax=Conexibacter woesei (strain DSM 14684 / CCUG 47730 / CIP 108061 / JCM 11494 / NBRC 100937 / ID131577) TaxID=469383 RepID=D3F5K1_CONWI|nr:MBL fold metallo-hydrolase [Conexibacter woesei]ADB50668.1 conserved hypothetical protein [Conexibacter woesei DSM 14684]
MRLRLIRNATLRLEYAGRDLLLDPCLDDARSWAPIEGILHADVPSPLRPLPEPAERVVAGLDGVLATHLHVDHWDATARRLLPAAIPLACQPADAAALHAQGFTAVRAVEGGSAAEWLGIELQRTGGRHSAGPAAEALGPVSGFVLRAPGEPVLYVAGDSVWCEEVEQALARHAPDVVVLNCGAASLADGERITMDAGDVARVLEAAPAAIVVAVHFETVSHCVLTREQLRAALPGAPGAPARLRVPDDGETLLLSL